MKKILMRMAYIVYSMGSCFILGMAILSPFMWGSDDVPTWLYWVIYPLTLLIMASQKEMHAFFDKLDV